MDIATLLSQYKDPAAVLAFVVALAVTVRFLSRRLDKTEEIVENIRSNHLAHISDSVIRIESILGELPCRTKYGNHNEEGCNKKDKQ